VTDDAPDSDKRIIVEAIEPVDTHGHYANFVKVRATEFDFVLDFAQMVPPVDEAALQSQAVIRFPTKVRVVLPVVVVPALVGALQQTLDRFMQARGLASGQGQTDETKA